MEQKTNFDIIIIGAGLVGSCFAVDIATKCPHLKIGLIDQFAPTSTTFDLQHTTYLNELIQQNHFADRIYAIAPVNVTYLSSLGIWPDLRSTLIKYMHIVADNGNKLELDYKMSQQLCLAQTIEAPVLQRQIYQRLFELNINIISDTLTNFVNHADYLELSAASGRIYKTALCVSATGMESALQTQLSITIKRYHYQQQAIVANFNCQTSHLNTAYQWFLAGGDVIAYLPLPNNNISLVWSTSRGSELTQLNASAFVDELSKSNPYGNFLNFTLTNTPRSFPLTMQIPQSVYQQRFVLIGDAAHSIHPLAGMGVNLGFSDSAILATVLAQTSRAKLCDSATLAKYAYLQSFHVKKMQLGCHFLHKFFKSELALLKLIRNKGMSVLNSNYFAKKYLINYVI